MKRAAFLMMALVAPVACQGQVETDEGKGGGEVAALSAALGTGCNPSDPPCACLLRGTPACDDPDHDGVLNKDDNCRFTANPNQANCDGDGSGDVCDDVNVVVSKDTRGGDVHSQFTGSSECVGRSGDNFGERFDEFEVSRDVVVTETRQFCGPSGDRTERSETSSVVRLGICYNDSRSTCVLPNTERAPSPSCGP